MEYIPPPTTILLELQHTLERLEDVKERLEDSRNAIDNRLKQINVAIKLLQDNPEVMAILHTLEEANIF